MRDFDLTPDPKVLVALTHTPLQPLDALCELIDNAIDSFGAAAIKGDVVEAPLVVVTLPGRSEVEQGAGVLRVLDNGPGMSAEAAERALKAGFSGNNPYDSLGLFGMGLNISTGKLGRITRFRTTRAEDDFALEVVVNLVRLQEEHSYAAPVSEVPKPVEFGHGTIVEVEDWWSAGSPNHGFVKKLVSYGMPTVRRELGRRYATFLRDGRVRIMVNGEACVAFDHCVWGDDRFVERQGHGQIPAIFRFDESAGSQVRCLECTALVPAGGSECLDCGSSHLRTIQERLEGWVGIQRFDHRTDYGIDLIRNGRAIRIAEQAAFFEFTDEFKKTIKDYPIDQDFGRIVGEVHLNHVPVDFMKQDFQRSSEEWQRAISYLRGNSSLQPQQTGADGNRSPVFKLYQGYRKVRNPGKRDMYMGYWDPPSGKPKRIARAIEEDYYARFLGREPGYLDDEEWWRLVEEADRPPLDAFTHCPECGAQNLQSLETCQACGAVLIGKGCVNDECGETIPASAVSCPHCGSSQIPEVEEPWTCAVCGTVNGADDDVCVTCSSAIGSPSPTSIEFLLENSAQADDLSLTGCSVVLADASHSQPIDVLCYLVRTPMRPRWEGESVPMISYKGERIDLFMDASHKLFQTYGVRPEQIVATEIAQYIYTVHGRLLSERYQAEHTLANLTLQVLERGWGDVLEDGPDRVRDDVIALFDAIRARLPILLEGQAGDIFDDLTDTQKRNLVDNMLGQGIDLAVLPEMKHDGSFLKLVSESVIIDLFRRRPDVFFDGGLWNVQFRQMPDLDDAIADDVRARVRATYGNCLEDVAAFLLYSSPERIIAQRARASLEFLQQRFRE